MAKGKILANLGDGKYSVELIKDEEKINKRKNELLLVKKGINDELTALTNKLDELNEKEINLKFEIDNFEIVNEETMHQFQQLHVAMRQNAKEIVNVVNEKKDVEIKLNSVSLSLQFIDENELVRKTVQAKSVELFDGFNTGQVVAVIESAYETNTSKEYYIDREAPEFAYSQPIHGLETPITAMNPYEFFAHMYSLPEKLVNEPRYWYGIIKDINGEVADIELVHASHGFTVDIFPANKRNLTDVPKINGGYFRFPEAGKTCVVTFEQGLDQPKVLYSDTIDTQYHMAIIGSGYKQYTFFQDTLKLKHYHNMGSHPDYYYESIYPNIFIESPSDEPMIDTGLVLNDLRSYRVNRTQTGLVVNYTYKTGQSGQIEYDLLNQLKNTLTFKEYETGKIITNPTSGVAYSTESEVFQRIYQSGQAADEDDPVVAFEILVESNGSQYVEYTYDTGELLVVEYDIYADPYFDNFYIISPITQSEMDKLKQTEE